MLVFRRPDEREVRTILDEVRDRPPTYGEVGATRSGVIPGFPVNHHRGHVGQGAADFARAEAAMDVWAMYRTGWTLLSPVRPEVREGRDFAVVARHPGFWSVNPCRIVYTLEEDGNVARKGFAIATLPGHLERGEERFTVEWHHSDDSVWFELFACAAAEHPLLKAGYPLMRLGQHLFGKAAVKAMGRAVGG